MRINHSPPLLCRPFPSIEALGSDQVLVVPPFPDLASRLTGSISLPSRETPPLEKKFVFSPPRASSRPGAFPSQPRDSPRVRGREGGTRPGPRLFAGIIMRREFAGLSFEEREKSVCFPSCRVVRSKSPQTSLLSCVCWPPPRYFPKCLLCELSSLDLSISLPRGGQFTIEGAHKKNRRVKWSP